MGTDSGCQQSLLELHSSSQGLVSYKQVTQPSFPGVPQSLISYFPSSLQIPHTWTLLYNPLLYLISWNLESSCPGGLPQRDLHRISATMGLSGFKLHFATGSPMETKLHAEEHCIKAIMEQQPGCSLSCMGCTCGWAEFPRDGGIVLALKLKFYVSFSATSPSGLMDMTFYLVVSSFTKW